MPGLLQSFHVRLVPLLTGVLLGLAGLAFTSLESTSFGHGHLAGGHATHHRHLFFGSHEHPDAEHDHDPHEQGDRPPAPQGRDSPRRVSTVSMAPALFQPVPACSLDAPAPDFTPIVASLAMPQGSRPVVQSASLRAPPPSPAVPDSLG